MRFLDRLLLLSHSQSVVSSSSNLATHPPPLSDADEANSAPAKRERESRQTDSKGEERERRGWERLIGAIRGGDGKVRRSQRENWSGHPSFPSGMMGELVKQHNSAFSPRA